MRKSSVVCLLAALFVLGTIFTIPAHAFNPFIGSASGTGFNCCLSISASVTYTVQNVNDLIVILYNVEPNGGSINALALGGVSASCINSDKIDQNTLGYTVTPDMGDAVISYVSGLVITTGSCTFTVTQTLSAPCSGDTGCSSTITVYEIEGYTNAGDTVTSTTSGSANPSATGSTAFTGNPLLIGQLFTERAMTGLNHGTGFTTGGLGGGRANEWANSGVSSPTTFPFVTDGTHNWIEFGIIYPSDVSFVTQTITFTYESVVAPSPLSLNYWVYPLIFLGCYDALFFGSGAIAKVSTKALIYLLLCGFVDGSLLAVILGILQFELTILSLVVFFIYVLRK